METPANGDNIEQRICCVCIHGMGVDAFAGISTVFDDHFTLVILMIMSFAVTYRGADTAGGSCDNAARTDGSGGCLCVACLLACSSPCIEA